MVEDIQNLKFTGYESSEADHQNNLQLSFLLGGERALPPCYNQFLELIEVRIINIHN